MVHLYPDQLNLYGDRGNVLTLVRRCQWRGLSVALRTVDLGETLDPDWGDLYIMGGGQDRQQQLVCDDLHMLKAAPLKEALMQQKAVMLGICGGYQLMGHYYRPHEGSELPGLGIMDMTTVAGYRRMIGNILIERPDGMTVVGFENHSGLTRLGPGLQALGRVQYGYGNNGEDQMEGAVSNHLYGTYLHGSLLPKNPSLADELLIKALSRRHGAIALEPLNDQMEHAAQAQAMRHMKTSLH